MPDQDILIKDRTELDFLLINIEAAVRVKKRSDFFSWVQGVFQGLVSHDLLVCALADPASGRYRMEWMSSQPLDEATISRLCGTSGSLVHQLILWWEKTGREPIMIGPGGSPQPDPFLLSEIDRLRLDNVVAHGVPDLEARAAAFFSFFRLPNLAERHASALELTVPHLHAAWARATCAAGRRGPFGPIHGCEVLTAREIEVLNWVEQGKSNSEIAQILCISQLTVKNHVQKVLRKLNVRNRAQAVAKGIRLNITRPIGPPFHP